MSDDTPPTNLDEMDISAIVEALLNICGQAAEMQVNDDDRDIIYDMCDIMAAYHGIPRVDTEIVDNEDGSTTVHYITREEDKPKLHLVVNNLDEPTPDDTMH